MAYRIDLFAIFIFLGVVQAIFLSFFFFSKESREKSFNVFQGLMLLSIAGCLLEVVLLYSGYIIHILHLVDFSEPLALLIGPFFYLFVKALTKGTPAKKTIWIHLAFPIVYTLAFIPFLMAPSDVKYNAWMYAYHPGAPLRPWNLDYDPWMFKLTEYHTELVLICLVLYVVLGGLAIVQAFREKASSFWRPDTYALKILRNGVIQIFLFLLLILAVKIFNEEDTGDHLSAAFGALLVYAMSFSVIKNSSFFKQIPITEDKKYKGSSLNDGERDRLANVIEEIMASHKPYLKDDFSLPVLAQASRSSVHSVSQVINEKFQKSFFEWMAEYRIAEAKAILKKSPHLKIEEVAERVGYNSKSSFNTTFKKITGLTPSEFRNSG